MICQPGSQYQGKTVYEVTEASDDDEEVCKASDAGVELRGSFRSGVWYDVLNINHSLCASVPQWALC